MNNFCPYPWVGIDISPQTGGIRPCCKYNKVIADNIDEYFQSAELAQLKQDFENNQKPPGCSTCWNEEAANKPSKRLIDINFVFDKNPDITKIQVLSIPFGNTCNLACRTCNSYFSSRWIKDEKRLVKKFPSVKIYNHNKYYKNQQFINQIQSLSKDLIEITFHGGESFITGVDEQIEYLDFLLSNNPNKITLNYITNVTTFPDKEFWTRWTKFKRINIVFSLDGINQRYEYLRYPAKWDEVYKNIKLYQLKQKECNNLQLSINHVLSLINIYYIFEFSLWCVKEKLPNPHFSLVEYPNYLDIRCLPIGVKNTLSKHLNPSLHKDIINYMNQPGSADFEDSLARIDAIDKLRSQDFKSVFPEMADIIKANKY